MPLRTIVIGAGYAGLTAALALAEAGADVTVLEARDRVGGRAWTVRTASGAAVDLGAQWIGPPHARLLALAARFGIATVAAPTGNTLVLDGERRIRMGPALIARSPRAALDLVRAIPALDRLGSDVSAATPWTAADAEALDARSAGDWIESAARSAQGRGILRLIVETGISADAGDVSLLGALGALAGAGGAVSLLGGKAEEDMFADGSDALARAMADRLGDAVRVGSPVSAIEQDAASITVVAADGTRLSADRVIVATPPTFAARLGAASWRAGMSRGGVLKAIAVFDEPFWRADGATGMTLAIDDAPVSSTFDVSRGGVGMLATLVIGSRAAALAALSDGDRRAAIVAGFVRAVGPAAARPVEVHAHAWIADPWTRGGYGELAPPGLLTEVRTLGAEPEGRLHFAGTETSPEWSGYLEGAVRSGERAAAEVLAAA